VKKLERRLGLGAIIAISISSMLGSGIFVLPGIAITITGPSVWLAYLLAAIAVLPAALSKSELASAMPSSGGTYVYLERSFGPLVGTVAGLGLWLSLLLKASFALVGFGAYLKILAPSVQLVPTSLGILTFIVVMNILGVGKVSSLLIAVVITCITCLAVISVGGIFQFDFNYMTPLFPHGSEGLISATALVFVSYAGVTKVAAIAEEIKDPEKNLPRGILISLLIVSIVYAGVTFILSGLFPAEFLANNLKPIYYMAQKAEGNIAGNITAVVAIVTMSSMANAGILAASRFPFAMGRDKLIPSIFCKIHSKFLTPVPSIIASGLLVAISLLYLDVTKIAKFASAFMLMMFFGVNVTVIVLRETRVQWYKPSYKSHFYPYVQILGIFFTVSLLIGMGLDLLMNAILSIVIPGVLLYLVYARRKTDRKGVIGIRGKRNDLIDESPQVVSRSKIENMDLSQDAKVVVSLFGKERSPEMLIEMGIALAEHGNLEVAHITEVPEQTDLDDMMDEPAELRSLRRRVVAMAIEKGEPISFDPVVSHDLAKTIHHISQRLHCQWLMIEWRGKSANAFTFHNPIGWLKGHLSCNLAIFRDSGVRYIRKILVVIRRNENDYIALDTADHLAQVNTADITIIKIIPKDTDEVRVETIQKKLQKFSESIKTRTAYEIVRSDKEVESVLSITAEYDLFIFGSKKQTFLTSAFGSDDDKLISKAACSVISVQSSGEWA
tara:strand:- start:3507 stop:5681 length:2175 start_codon:yes stop_codon:yes gene_type:complete